MLSTIQVATVLERVRPMLQADGGDIELVGLVGNRAQVRLTGACADCPVAPMTLHMGVEVALREALPELEGLMVV